MGTRERKNSAPGGAQGAQTGLVAARGAARQVAAHVMRVNAQQVTQACANLSYYALKRQHDARCKLVKECHMPLHACLLHAWYPGKQETCQYCT